MIALPGYLNKDAWQAFLDMRNTIKKPLTVYAAKLVLYELQRIKDAGHDPNAALDQSILNCWKDVFVPKDKEIAMKRSSEAERTQELLIARAKHDEQTPEQRAATAARLAEAKNKLRRVA